MYLRFVPNRVGVGVSSQSRNVNKILDPKFSCNLNENRWNVKNVCFDNGKNSQKRTSKERKMRERNRYRSNVGCSIHVDFTHGEVSCIPVPSQEVHDNIRFFHGLRRKNTTKKRTKILFKKMAKKDGKKQKNNNC